MTHGIIIYDETGSKILDSTKKLGRFVGWHDVNPAPVGQFRYSWDHRNLLPMGEIFVWVNPSFWFNHNGWCDCRVEGGMIIFEGNLRRNDEQRAKETYMRILYGVKS